MPESKVRVSGADSWGKSVPNVWTTNSEGPPSELSPGSSNDGSSGGSRTKSPLSVNLVGLPWYATGGQDRALAGQQHSARAEVASESRREGRQGTELQ